MHVNDVAQDVVDAIDEADVASDRNVSMMRRRWRQLAREFTWDGVFALAEVRIDSPAGLQAGFLIRREPILRAEARRRFALVLLIPVVRRLTGMVVELHRASRTLSRRAGGSRLGADRRRYRDKSQCTRNYTEF